MICQICVKIGSGLKHDNFCFLFFRPGLVYDNFCFLYF